LVHRIRSAQLCRMCYDSLNTELRFYPCAELDKVQKENIIACPQAKTGLSCRCVRRVKMLSPPGRGRHVPFACVLRMESDMAEQRLPLQYKAGSKDRAASSKPGGYA
jgi:hypothetical protein